MKLQETIHQNLEEKFRMNLGFWMCVVLVPTFAVIGLLFGIFKEKSAKFISGFNTLPKEEKNLYDKEKMALDMRNSYYLWTIIMSLGALGSYFISAYFAIIAYVVWGILFFRGVHIDAHKAFEKYLIK